MNVVEAPEIIETSRLVLRRPRREDASAIFERYAQDPEVTRYLAWKPHDAIERTYAFLGRCETVLKTGEAFPWTIVLQRNGIIGMIELRLSGHRAEIGYVLARSYWNRGYMTEAMQAIVKWTLAQPGIYRVWAFCDVENAASARVLEKAGMQREGILRRWIIHPNVSEEPRDCYSYAIVK